MALRLFRCRHGIRLWSGSMACMEWYIPNDDPMKQSDGPLPETIAEIRSRARSLRAKRGLAGNRVRSLPIGCAPVGFRNRRDAEGQPYVEPDPVLAPIVAEAFHLRDRGMPIRKILAELTPKGLVSRNGKPMGPSALLAVLRNPLCASLAKNKPE